MILVATDKERETMFSEKSKKNADACRFCWMCRHLCPVQLVTGKETNTPRAKGLSSAPA